ncbi:MAG: phenylacetate--CoA ligase family protein [Candidatus Abyssobacteria bacterium SURF_17]|uniref:Phenylacetate--CoA ligase family protein n=1 Tax=Candidatus Abyssobacteria bacterium SURF_17 TaxID=2093361 RepID=A0A419F2I4_9BACT|nr:MAG: phenylacetate--CoA ligase family protein [Candidatus Abyssubacteria bacterium SURF_17]
MDWYAPIVKNIIHPLWAFTDGETHIALWRELERSQYFSRDEIARLQLNRLRTMVGHAYENCPFYRERLDSVGFSPADLRDFADLARIPMLTKEDIQVHKDDLVARNIAKSDLLPDKTGGSTGKPLHYYRDRRRMDYLKASAMRHDRWAGYEVGDKLAVIWGNRHDFSATQELKWHIRNMVLERKLILDSSSITEERMHEFARKLRKFKPEAILTYANSGALFASFLLENNIRDIRVKSVITSAEMLHNGERETIAEAFGCEVFDRYGCREVGVIASECEAHAGMHISAECVFVEFVRNGRPAGSGEEGDVVITDLLNFGMPLIRYRIEDIGIPSDRTCSCGRGLPLMEMVGGRVTDFLVAPDGRRVSGASLTIYLIANTPGVRQAQIVQNVPYALHIKIVKGVEFTDDSISFLKRKVAEFFGHEVELEIEFVSDIPKEVSGKYRFSICNIGRRNDSDVS